MSGPLRDFLWPSGDLCSGQGSSSAHESPRGVGEISFQKEGTPKGRIEASFLMMVLGLDLSNGILRAEACLPG